MKKFRPDVIQREHKVTKDVDYAHRKCATTKEHNIRELKPDIKDADAPYSEGWDDENEPKCPGKCGESLFVEKESLKFEEEQIVNIPLKREEK